MVRKYIRLIIAGVLLLGGVGLIVKGFVSEGILTILLSGLFTLLHFKNERNLLAFYFVRKNKMEKAAKILAKVKHPESMTKSQEAYHYFLNGITQMQLHNINKAEKSFKKALSTGLRMKNDQAVAKLNLAGTALSRRNKKLAKYYVQETKKLDKNKMLSEQIKEIEYNMKRI